MVNRFQTDSYEQQRARWLLYFLLASDLDGSLKQHFTGAGIQHFTGQSFKKMKVPLLPLSEQQRIVAILDAAFEGIATATANAEKNLANSRELFQAGAAALLGRVGPNWHEMRLGELCKIARGGSPRPIQAYLTDAANGVNWIKISDATASGKVIYKTQQKIRPEGVTRSRMVYSGDLLLSNSMSFGRPYILGTAGCIHDGWLVLSANPIRYDQDFLYHLLGSKMIFRQFDKFAAGSTVRNLNIDLVGRVRVCLPPLAEQRAIGEKLDRLGERTAEFEGQYRRKLAALAELKKSLLARAFSGELTARDALAA